MKNIDQKDYFDEGWKEIIELYFTQFLQFFFNKIYKSIDFKKGYEFLDKELIKILKDNITGKRKADKLVKVYLNDGTLQYLLIHIEIQGKSEKKFEERMYVYNYRIYDKYRINVVSLVVLADSSKKFRPNRYEVIYWDFKHIFEFPAIKLLDYQDKLDILEKSKNIFALIVIAHLKSLETKKDIDKRMFTKISLIKKLYEKGYSKKDILNLYRFIDWIMNLSRELNDKVYIEIKKYEEVKKMSYVTTAERIGIQKGIQKGIQEGIQEGRQEGVLANKQDVLIELIETKFSRISGTDAKTIKQYKNLLKLDKAIKKILTAATVKEIMRILAK